MKITLNGDACEVAAGTALSALLDDYGTPREGSAVAINGDVVPRSRHTETLLHAGDRIEIIVAVAGG